jgi:FkbM family methyltransferase
MTAEKDIDRVVRDAFFPDGTSGVLVEVGAARPDYLSVSASFRKRGWKIIAVEPNPDFCALHRAKGHHVLQYACSDEDKDNVDFFVVDSNGADYLGGNVSFESFSSLGIRDKYAELHETVKGNTNTKKIAVNVRKLDTILAEYYPEVEGIDIVSVDVEGWELTVMRGLTFEKYRPKVVILENLFYSDSYSDFMRERGYRLWKTLSPNEVFIRPDMKPDTWSSIRGSFRSILGVES